MGQRSGSGGSDRSGGGPGAEEARTEGSAPGLTSGLALGLERSGIVNLSAALQAAWRVAPAGIAGGDMTGIGASGWLPQHSEKREAAPPPDRLNHVVVAILSGTAETEVFVEGACRAAGVAGPGDVTLLRAGERWRWVSRAADFACVSICLPDLLLRQVVERDMERSATSLELRPIAMEKDSAMAWVARELFAEMRLGGPVTRMAVDGIALVAAAHVARRWSNFTVPRPRARGGLAPHALRRACQYLDAHLGQEVTLAQVAREVALSPKHFARAFRESTGLPPHQWLLARRVDRARALLAGSDAPIASVALACGFSDQSHFTNRFRQATGTTPARYRHEVRGDAPSGIAGSGRVGPISVQDNMTRDGVRGTHGGG